MQTKATNNAPQTQDPQQEQPDNWGEGTPAAEQPFQDAGEQALRAAPAEIDQEGALYVDEDSVLRGELNNLSDVTQADEERKDSRPNDSTLPANLPFPIPREMCLHIFSFLNTQNLQSTALLSRQSYALSAEIRKRHFLKKFSNSHWWKFLIALAENVPGEGEQKFVDVLILEMGPGTRIPNGWRETCATISSYVTRWMEWYPDKIQRLGFGVSGYEDIQKKAQSLLAMMCNDNVRTDFHACTTLKECIALVEDKNKIVALQHYDDLDRLFSCLILFEFMSVRPAHDRLNFLIRTPFARGLTGEGLIALESQFPGLFPALVREAIRLFQIEVKLAADQQRLEAIERILGRLTEADILRYIGTETDTPPFISRIPLQRQIFIDALRSNYEHLLTKMTIVILERLEHQNKHKRYREFKDLLVVPHVVQNSLILSKIGSENILSLFNLLSESDVAEVINKYVLLQPYCSVEIMQELLKVDVGHSALAKVFLSNKILLDKLSDDHIFAFAQHLMYSDFEDVLNNHALQEKLQTFPDNALLMRLAKSNNKARLGRYILRNTTVSLLLTADQAIEVYNYTPTYFDEPFISNIALMDKLSSGQLIHLLRYCGNKFDLTVVQGRLHKFTNSDLVLLVRSKVSKDTATELGNYLLESLPAQIDRRVSPDIEPHYRLNSDVLCKLGCVHQQLACYILDHYGDRLSTNEYVLIRDHYPLNSYDSNTPIRFAIAKEQEKRLERLKRTSKASVTNSSPTVTSPSTITHKKSTPSNHKTRKDPHEPKPTQETSLLSEDEWSWVYFIIQLLCVIGAVFGLLLAISGIGSAAGIGIVSTITQLFFASLPMSHALAAGIVGLGIFIASSVGWLAADDAKQNALTLKNKTSEVELSHKTNDAQFNKQHGIAFNYPNNPTAQPGKTTHNKEGDSSNDGAEEEMLVDPEFCRSYNITNI